MEHEREIRRKLTAIGEDYDQIPDNLKTYLFSIQGVIERKQLEQHAAIRALKDNEITVSGICGELNMSRNTVYRYGGLLQRYIELCANQLSSTNPLSMAEKLREENTEKQRQLALMADRDTQMLASKMASYHRDRLLKEKNELLEQQKTRILKLSQECLQLRVALEQCNPEHKLLKFP